jgi:hypothetical protein
VKLIRRSIVEIGLLDGFDVDSPTRPAQRLIGGDPLLDATEPAEKAFHVSQATPPPPRPTALVEVLPLISLPWNFALDPKLTQTPPPAPARA